MVSILMSSDARRVHANQLLWSVHPSVICTANTAMCGYVNRSFSGQTYEIRRIQFGGCKGRLGTFRSILLIFSGGSRIFMRGRQLPKWVCKPIILQIFAKKTA